MADETREKLEEIEKSTDNISRTFTKILREIEKSAKETNVWLDATKALQSAQSGIQRSQESLRNIGTEINKNKKEEKRLRNEELPQLQDKLRKMVAQQAQLERDANIERAIIDDVRKSDVAKEGAKNRLLALDDRSAELAKEKNKTSKREVDITEKIIPALNAANVKLHKQKEIAVQIYETERDRKELAEKVGKLHEALIKPLTEESKEFGKIKSLVMDVAKGGLTAWLALLQASLERWKELDKAAGDFRIKTGFLVSQTRELNNSAREVNVEMAQIGVGLDEAYGAASALTNQFQVIGIVTKDMVKDTAQMAANLGISVEDSAKIRSIFTSISKSSGITATQMMGAAARLAEMGGVAPAVVMKDIAEASEDSLKFLSKSPLALMRAAVEARRLGTTINSLSKSSRGFLNFQDSITSELTASAMVGKSLNFQAARRAAWEKDIVKSRQLALKEISKLGDFNKLDILQQEEVAKAAHMTVDEIIQQQNQTKILAALEKERPEMYKEYMAMQKKLREDEKAGTKDLVKQGEELVKRQMRQTELNKLTNSFKQIWTDISDALLPIANIIMPIIITAVRLLIFPIKLISSFVKGMLKPFDIIGSSLRSGNNSAMSMEKAMAGVAKFTENAAKWMEKLGELAGGIAKIYLWWTFFTGTLGRTNAYFRLMSLRVGEIWTAFKNIGIAFSNVFSGAGIGRSVSALFGYIGGKVSALKTAVSNVFSGAGMFSGIGRSVSAMFSDIGRRASQFFGYIGGKFSGLKTALKPIGDAFSAFFSAISSGSGVFARLFTFLGKFGTKFLKIFSIGIKKVPFIGWAISGLEAIWKLSSKFIDLWNDDSLNPGEKILKALVAIPAVLYDVFLSVFVDIGEWISRKLFGDGFTDKIVNGLSSIKNTVFDVLKWPFKKFLGWFKSDSQLAGESPSGIGLMLVDGLTSVGSMIFGALSSPFKKVMNFVSGIFGKNVGIARMIVDAIKSIGGTIFNTLSSAFKKVMEFVSSIPLIGRFFGGKDASKAAIEAKSIVESKINHMVEIVNMDELKMSIDKLTEAISSLGGAAGGSTPVVTVNNNSDAMISKLDELIDLLTGGAVAVHMDGALVSKALARVS